MDDIDVLATAVEIEKRLCKALGRSWTPAGISVETLVNDAIAEIGRLRDKLKKIAEHPDTPVHGLDALSKRIREYWLQNPGQFCFAHEVCKSEPCVCAKRTAEIILGVPNDPEKREAGTHGAIAGEGEDD